MRIGIHCPVDDAEIPDHTCLACRESSIPRPVRHCDFSHEMLQGMMDSSGRSTAHISATMLTAACPRQVYLKQHADYYEDPSKMFAAWRGTMGHKMTEAYPQDGCIYEQRFESAIVINGSTVKITGAIDKLDIRGKRIEDFKTKSEKKLEKMVRPDPAHTKQLNIYRWLVKTGWPQEEFELDGKIYKPGIASNIDIDHLKLVYWSMNEPRALPARLMKMEDIEKYVIERATTIQTLPDVPKTFDPMASVFCLQWCPVRSACIEADVGF